MWNDPEISNKDFEKDVCETKEMITSWLENGARDMATIHGFRSANLIPKKVWKRAKEELGVISFKCPIKGHWIYALPNVRNE